MRSIGIDIGEYSIKVVELIQNKINTGKYDIFLSSQLHFSIIALISGATAIIDNMIIVFRILFFTGFMWALYRAYDKYTQQAELLDVIQTPIVLLVVVGIIDAAALMFLGAKHFPTSRVQLID